MNFCRPSNKTVNKTIIAVNQSLQCCCLESFSIHIIFRTLERYNDRHMATIKSGHYHRKKFQKNIQVFWLIPIFRKNTLMGKRAISNFSTEITLMCFLNLSVFLAINIKTGKNHGWFYIEIHLWDFRELKTLLWFIKTMNVYNIGPLLVYLFPINAYANNH